MKTKLKPVAIFDAEETALIVKALIRQADQTDCAASRKLSSAIIESFMAAGDSMGALARKMSVHDFREAQPATSVEAAFNHTIANPKRPQ